MLNNECIAMKNQRHSFTIANGVLVWLMGK